MSVVFDNGGNFSHTNLDTWSDNFAVGAGSNRILIVTIYVNQGRTVTALTYNGVALTQLGATQNTSSSTWYLIAPASGTHALAGTLSASSNGFQIVAVSYTGANQSALDNSVVSASSSSTSFSQSLTPTVPNCLVIGATHDDGNGGRTFTAGTATTRRATDSANCAIFEHNGFVNPAASTAIVATISGPATLWYYWLISLSPVQTTASKVETVTLSDSGVANGTRIVTIINTVTISDVIQATKNVWEFTARGAEAVWTFLTKPSS